MKTTILTWLITRSKIAWKSELVHSGTPIVSLLYIDHISTQKCLNCQDFIVLVVLYLLSNCFLYILMLDYSIVIVSRILFTSGISNSGFLMASNPSDVQDNFDVVSFEQTVSEDAISPPLATNPQNMSLNVLILSLL